VTERCRETEEPTFKQVKRIHQTVANDEHKSLHKPPDERPVACHGDFLFHMLRCADFHVLVCPMIEGSRKLKDVAHGDQIEEFIDVSNVDDMRWAPQA
jgi:hypothetical protein